MEKGYVFRVDNIEYVIALCTQTEGGNIAILLRRTDNYGYLTVSNLQSDSRGNYSWELSRRTGSYDEAVADYIKRLTA